MNKQFPNDCPNDCPYLERWDLSVDDYTNICNKLHVQVDDMDTYSPFYVPLLCPINESEVQK